MTIKVAVGQVWHMSQYQDDETWEIIELRPEPHNTSIKVFAAYCSPRRHITYTITLFGIATADLTPTWDLCIWKIKMPLTPEEQAALEDQKRREAHADKYL